MQDLPPQGRLARAIFAIELTVGPQRTEPARVATEARRRAEARDDLASSLAVARGTLCAARRARRRARAIQHIHGRTASTSSCHRGDVNLNIIDMARERSARTARVGAARDHARRRSQLEREASRVDPTGAIGTVHLRVSTARRAGARAPLLPRLVRDLGTRQEAARPRWGGEPVAEGSDARRGAQLEEELRRCAGSPEGTSTSFKSANEELASANEEAQSSNEELQSTNEELQTAKEETQSLNEELHTVNAELTEKLRDLRAGNRRPA